MASIRRAASLPRPSLATFVAGLIFSWCTSIPAASAKGSRHHAAGDGRSGPGRGRHPARNERRNGHSPNDHMLDDFRLSSASFYERHGLAPPPLISRAERRRRRAQEEAGGAIFEDQTTELDLIVEEAKEGTNAATRLRKDLIRTGKYDRHAYPWDYPWYGQGEGERTGVPVEVGINFHRVYSVDVINPVLDLVVWFRMVWTDPRLTWKPEEYGNLTKTWFWIGDGGSGGETSEIWTPDIELWNLEEGLRESFDDAYAIVSNDGSIFWSRPGHLRPVCKYYGLDNFPFDRLTCTLEFGSWAYSGKFLRPVKMGEGYTIGGSETAGESFNEFSFIDEDPVQCTQLIYPPYIASPEEDWPVLLYNVTIERAWQPYARGYITMQVLLNIVGFSAFWLPPSCGERMGLSITAMLAAVAAEIVVAANLPSAAEYTWFQKFSLLSMAFAFVSLIESVAVLYFYYKRTEDVIPQWYTEFRKWWVFRQARKRGGEVISQSVKRSTVVLAEVNDSLHKKVDGVRETIIRKNSEPHDPKYDEEDSFSENMRSGSGTQNDEKAPGPKNDENESFYDANEEVGKMLDDSDREAARIFEQNNTDERAGGGSGDEDSLELVEGDLGTIKTGKSLQDSCVSKLSFDGMADSDDKLKPTKRSSRGAKEKHVNFSGVFKSEQRLLRGLEDKEPSFKRRLSLEDVPQTRSGMMRSFQENAAAMASTRSLSSMVVPRDADDFNNEEERENNIRWKKISSRIDDLARFWIPMTFFVSLAIILGQVL